MELSEKAHFRKPCEVQSKGIFQGPILTTTCHIFPQFLHAFQKKLLEKLSNRTRWNTIGCYQKHLLCLCSLRRIYARGGKLSVPVDGIHVYFMKNVFILLYFQN